MTKDVAKVVDKMHYSTLTICLPPLVGDLSGGC